MGESWHIITQGKWVLLWFKVIKLVPNFLVAKVNRKTQSVEISLVIYNAKAYQFFGREKAFSHRSELNVLSESYRGH